MELVQLLISGISQGCVYGLIALGFVLIYKATEMVNFAQGDLMMLGAFIAFGFINVLGWPFLWGFLATLAVMGVVGATLERLLLRPMIGEPPFAVLMLTIGLGFILRAVAGAIWGYEDKTLSTPYGGGVARWGEISVGYENIAVVLGTLVLCVLVFVFFRKTRVGIAMQAASQNQLAAYYVGIGHSGVMRSGFRLFSKDEGRDRDASRVSKSASRILCWYSGEVDLCPGLGDVCNDFGNRGDTCRTVVAH